MSIALGCVPWISFSHLTVTGRKDTFACLPRSQVLETLGLVLEPSLGL